MKATEIQKNYDLVDPFVIKTTPISEGSGTRSFAKFVQQISNEEVWWKEYVQFQFSGESLSYLQQIRGVISTIESSEDRSQLANYFNSIHQILRNNNFYSAKSPFVIYLASIAKNNPGLAQQVYANLVNDGTDYLNNKLLRYHVQRCYVLMGSSSTEKPLSSIDRIERETDDFYNKLTSEIESFESKIAQAQIENASAVSLLETATRVAAEEAKTTFADLHKNISSDFDLLKQTYEKFMSLKSPMGYWESIEKKARRSNLLWFSVAVLAGISIIITAITAYNLVPNLVIDPSKTYSVTDVIKWFILSSLIISVEVLVLRQALKISFSSLHMARDAQERRALSYMYLTLNRNGQVGGAEEKKIILSALFSRVDTGLLKGDSSPSFPGSGILDALMKGRTS